MGPFFRPFDAYLEHFGFVPAIFRAQSTLPRALEAEATMIEAVIVNSRALSRIRKECILLAVAVARGSAYWTALQYQTMLLLGMPEEIIDRIVTDYSRAGLSPADTALLNIASNLAGSDPVVSLEDIAGARAYRLSDEAILEAILTAALANFLCTLSTGVGPTPDFAPQSASSIMKALSHSDVPHGAGPHLRAPDLGDDFAPFAFLREQFGFVPGVFRAQTLRPNIIEAEATAIGTLLLADDLVGADPDKRLLDFKRKLTTQPSSFGKPDIDALRGQGFTEERILKAVVATSFATFLDTVAAGLGVNPDLKTSREFPAFAPNKAHLSTSGRRPTEVASPIDPDAECVAKAQNGDLDAFEKLMKRHSQRVYRTLVGILGNSEDARDAMQDSFLKAFEHLDGFQQRSKFSTWLVSIASNTGLQRLRERRPLESLDESPGDSEERFRPRQIQAWTDDPEQLYSQTEMRSLIESEVLNLPAKYRVVVVLRDVEQLSTEDAAAAIGLSIPALKTRLLRGRLMLREALAPHFVPSQTSDSAKGVNL